MHRERPFAGTSTRARRRPRLPSPGTPLTKTSSPTRGPCEVVPHDVDAARPRKSPQPPPQRLLSRARAPHRAERLEGSSSRQPPERLRGDLGVARDTQPAQRAATLRQCLDTLDAHEVVHAQVELEERAAPARHSGERGVVERVAPAEQQRP